MRKFWMLAFILSANCGTWLWAAPAPKADAKPGINAKVTQAADKVFKFADADHDGQLSPEEFKKAENQIPFQIRRLTTDHVIGGAKPIEVPGDAPALDPTQAVTSEQFRSYFVAAAKLADDDQRKAIAARPPQPRRTRRSANANPAPVFSGSGRRADDDETSAQRDARRRREEQQRQWQQQQVAQMRAAAERDSFRPTPPPNERPTPSRGGSGGERNPKGGGGGFPPGPGGKR